MFVHTAHGPGRVVEEQTVRGRKSFLVEGSGFKLWLDEKDLRVASDVNEDNSSHLPYDPTPQHPAEFFDTESTIQPGEYEIDAEERLDDSDSLTFDSVEEYPYPGPGEDNFAKEAGLFNDVFYDETPGWDERMIDKWVRKRNPNYEGGKGSSDEDEVRIMREGYFGRTPDGMHDNGGERRPEPGYSGKHRPPPMPLYAEPDPFDPSINGYEEWWADDKFDAQNGAATQEYLNSLGDEAPSRNPQRGTIPVSELQRKVQDPSYIPSELGWYNGDNALRRGEPVPQEPGMFQRLKQRFTGSHDDWRNEELEEREIARGPRRDPLEEEDMYADYLDRQKNSEIKHFSYRQAAGMADFASDAVDSVEDKGKKGRGDDEDDDRRGGIPSFNDAIDTIIPAGVSSHIYDDNWAPGHWPGRAASLYDRPAGLSDKYVRIAAPVDHFSDPVQQFRDDPISFIQKRGYSMSDSSNVRLAEYVDLVESDSSIRTAAWRDVRTKALRLRREGRVHVKDVAPDRIYAAVQGDSDLYETMIVKAGGVGPGSQTIAEWHCSCPWGQWAFNRKMSYIGRLCSHGYASYLEMESRNMKDVARRNKKRASVDRVGGIVEEFKEWAKKENNGHIDQGALDNFIYFCNSSQDGERTVITEEEADSLYDALDDMKSDGMVRNYDVDYLPDPEAAYKESSYRTADVLHTRPRSLTPDFKFIEDGAEGQGWLDVTEDERKTTGPDNMIKKSRFLEAIRYASDEELGHVVKDWAGVGDDLEKLREMSAEEPDYGNRREQNWQVRKVIDELNERGIDASQFVASLRYAEQAATDDEKKKGVKPASEQQPSMAGKSSDTGQPGGSSSVTKPDASQSAGTNQSSSDKPAAASSSSGASMSNPTKDPASVGFNSMPANSSAPRRDEESGSSAGNPLGGVDPNALISGFGQAAGSFMNAIPSIMQSTPAFLNGLTQFGNGIGSGLSGLGNSLSGGVNAINGLGNSLSGMAGMLHANNQHTATPIGGFPNVQLTNQESFQGSGPNPKYWYESSECYVDEHERPDFVDVTDLDDDPITKYTGDKPKQGPKNANRVAKEEWHEKKREDYRPYENAQDSVDRWLDERNLKFPAEDESYVYDYPFGREPINASRRPFVANEEDIRDDLLKAEGDEIHTLGEYHEFLDDARDSGDDYAADIFEEALNDEKDHARNFGEAVDRIAADTSNPKGSTLTTGGEIDESGVANLDSVFKAGGAAWDGHRVRDFRRFVKQKGAQPNHEALQEYLKQPRRGLDQGGKQHLIDYTSYAEQHPDEMGLGRQASFDDDGSDIVAQFHRMGGIEAINNSGGSGGGSYSDAAIAEQARGFLRTAGRVYSLAEQRELEEESHPSGARNLKDLDLRGTHYEDV